MQKVTATTEVILHEDAGTLPAPTALTSSSLAPLYVGGLYLPATGLLSIDAPEDSDPDAITIAAPVVLRARSQGRWRHVGTLNGGADIIITEFAGFQERVYFGGSWTDLVCVATSVLGGTITVTVQAEESQI